MFLPTGVIHVTTARRGKERPMSEKAIDSENISKSAPDPAKEKARTKAKKAKAANKARPKNQRASPKLTAPTRRPK
jgi:hypothetical protein